MEPAPALEKCRNWGSEGVLSNQREAQIAIWPKPGRKQARKRDPWSQESAKESKTVIPEVLVIKAEQL